MMRSLLLRCVRSELWPLVLLLGVATAPAGASLVEIKGGPDETRHNYEWTVINRHTSPVVRIEFPHYHADLFTAPPGWSTEETTYLVNVGVANKPGVCVATVPPDKGIPNGGRQTFRMRISAQGALVGEGKVTVKFKDGTSTVVTGVALPVPPPYSFKYLPLVGAAIIFAVWVIVRTLRERRRASSQPEANSPQAGGQDSGK